MPGKQSTIVKTSVSTQTKVVVGVAVAFMAGLAAYGFGFLPMLEGGNEDGGFENREAMREVCFQICDESTLQCKAAAETDEAQQACSQIAFDCLTSCQQQYPQSEPTDENAPGYQAPGYNGGSDVTPDRGATISDAFSVVIDTENFPKDGLVLGGADTWVPMATYRMKVPGQEAVLVDRLRASVVGDPSLLSGVGVMVNGEVVGWTVVPSGSDSATIEIAQPLRIASLGSMDFALVARFAHVIAPSATNSDASPKTGMRVSLAVGEADGYWTEYLGAVNVHAVGETSSVVLRASDQTMYAAGSPMKYVVKDYPVIQAHTVSSVLTRGSVADLYRFTMGAAREAVTLKKISFRIKSRSVDFDQFALRRGSTTMASGTVRILSADGRDLMHGESLRPVEDGQLVNVIFTEEQTLQGAGHVFTLQARAMTATQPAVEVSIASSNVDPGFKHRLVYQDQGDAYGPFVLEVPGQGNRWSSIIWSDMSDVPHSDTPGQSLDWMGGALLQDMSTVTSLTGATPAPASEFPTNESGSNPPSEFPKN